MENLVGISIETKDETRIKQLKIAIDSSILHLAGYMRNYPTKDEMQSYFLLLKTSMKKTNDPFLKLLQKWKG